MGELLVVAFLGGLITGLSPCIVPVIPVVMAGGSSSTNRARPYLIIAGIVSSFSLSVLFASSVLSFLHLPQDLLFWLGVAMLGLLAVGLMVPAVGEVDRAAVRPAEQLALRQPGGRIRSRAEPGPRLRALRRTGPHRDLGRRRPSSCRLDVRPRDDRLRRRCHGTAARARRGLANGPPSTGDRCAPICPPCAGWPVSCSPSRRSPSPSTGSERSSATCRATPRPSRTTSSRSAPPVRSSVSSAASTRTSSRRRTRSSRGRRRPAQRPTAASRRAGGSPPGRRPRRAESTVPRTSANQKPPMFTASKTDLPNLGRAPNFTGITAWFNTPADQPLSLSQLRGKVVLVDFWTYSCINCQRALPHVESWYNDYRKDGLVVVGVSAPEFAFEHVVSNVESAAGHLGIDYPVAVDDNLATWDAYNNEYWPAEYLDRPERERPGLRLRRGRVRAHGEQHPDASLGERGHGPASSHRRPGPDTHQPADHPGELCRVPAVVQRRRDPRGGRSRHHLPPAVHHPLEQLRLRRHLDRPRRGGDGGPQRLDRIAVHGQ